jgi:hypothetical protein
MMMGGRRDMSVEWKELPSSRISKILEDNKNPGLGFRV